MQKRLNMKKMIGCQSGQSLAEYILVSAIIALVLAGSLVIWKVPVAHYLLRIAAAITKIR